MRWPRRYSHTEYWRIYEDGYQAGVLDPGVRQHGDLPGAGIFSYAEYRPEVRCVHRLLGTVYRVFALVHRIPAVSEIFRRQTSDQVRRDRGDSKQHSLISADGLLRQDR